MILNETPIRTSKNFNINNINIENLEFPEVIDVFENIEVIGNIDVSNDISDFDLKYGLGDIILEQVKTKANQKLRLDINDNKKDDIELNFNFDSENKDLIDNIEINAKKDCSASIIIKYKSNDSRKNFHNGIIRVLAEENSKVNVIVVNLMNKVSNNFISIENNINENADVNFTIIDFGGKNSVTNYYSNLEGDFSNNSLNTIYLGNEDQLFDLNYIGEVKGKKANINIEVQGALADKANKHFKGTIDFKKGCKKATGNENESCLLLSDSARSIALPVLLCSEEDIEGNHSSSAGKAGEKELFYIMSRGFSLKEAMKLLVRARFNKILENIENEVLREEILNEIDRRLD